LLATRQTEQREREREREERERMKAKGGSPESQQVQIRNQHFCPLSSRKAADDKELDKGTKDK
jgi:hypothetical protein